jgi:hypothetical protein
LVILVVAAVSIAIAAATDGAQDAGGIVGASQFVGGLAVLTVLFGWRWFWSGSAVLAKRLELDTAFRDAVLRQLPSDRGEQDDPLPPTRKAEPDAYRALGVPFDASDDEVHDAWKRLAQIYHPDRLSGASIDVQQEAAARMSAINSAYAAIRAERRL